MGCLVMRVCSCLVLMLMCLMCSLFEVVDGLCVSGVSGRLLYCWVLCSLLCIVGVSGVSVWYFYFGWLARKIMLCVLVSSSLFVLCV